MTVHVTHSSLILSTCFVEYIMKNYYLYGHIFSKSNATSINNKKYHNLTTISGLLHVLSVDIIHFLYADYCGPQSTKR